MRTRVAIAFAAALLLAAASPAAASAQHTLRVVGGDPVSAPASAPWNVYVSSANEVCSGTLIDPLRVLTSATCVLSAGKLQAPQTLTTAAGVVRNDPGTDFGALQGRAVSAVSVHPGWGAGRYALAGADTEDNLSYAYDLALLTLSRPYDVTAQVAPVTLAPAPPRARSLLSLVGWGLFAFGAEEQFDIARSMFTRTTRATRCADGQPSLLCMVSSGRSPCFGDNGAAIVTLSRTLVGIHSYQDGKCVKGVPSGATSTTDPGVALWLLGDTSPPLAPSTRRLPTIDFAGPRDRQIICRAPAWRGATKLRTLFVDRATHRTLHSGSRLFRPRGEDRRRRIYCVSVAGNRGGVTEARSRDWVRVGTT